MAGIILRGMGKKQNLVTRGFRRLIIVVTTGGGGGYLPRRDDPDLIQTRMIKIPLYKDKIEVDVLLINKEDFKDISVIVNRWKQEYDEVHVYMEKDVEL